MKATTLTLNALIPPISVRDHSDDTAQHEEQSYEDEDAEDEVEDMD